MGDGLPVSTPPKNRTTRAYRNMYRAYISMHVCMNVNAYTFRPAYKIAYIVRITFSAVCLGKVEKTLRVNLANLSVIV